MNDTVNFSLNRLCKSIQPCFQGGSPPPRRCPPWCFGEGPSLLLVRDRRWSGLRCSAAAPPSHGPPIRKNIDGLVDWKNCTCLILIKIQCSYNSFEQICRKISPSWQHCSERWWQSAAGSSDRTSPTHRYGLRSGKQNNTKERVFRVEKVNLKQKFGAGEWPDRGRGVEQSFLSLGFQDAVHVLDLDCFCIYRDWWWSTCSCSGLGDETQPLLSINRTLILGLSIFNLGKERFQDVDVVSPHRGKQGKVETNLVIFVLGGAFKCVSTFTVFSSISFCTQATSFAAIPSARAVLMIMLFFETFLNTLRIESTMMLTCYFFVMFIRCFDTQNKEKRTPLKETERALPGVSCSSLSCKPTWIKF